MMKNYFSAVSLILILSVLINNLLFFNSCSKSSDKVEGNVEFYLLESFDTIYESSKINIENTITQTEPFIKYSELISYNKSKYEFELSTSALNTLKAKTYSTNGVGFALKAEGNIIYTGYFWPTYSSASCDWITINPLLSDDNNYITVSLGYPNASFAKNIKDNRNDSRILDIFRRDGKLIE